MTFLHLISFSFFLFFFYFISSISIHDLFSSLRFSIFIYQSMADYNKVETTDDIEKGESVHPPKKHSVQHKKSVYVHRRTCSACGHISEKETHLDIYPPPRPVTAIHQHNFNFIGYVVVIAIVIFLTFVAVKYIA